MRRLENIEVIGAQDTTRVLSGSCEKSANMHERGVVPKNPLCWKLSPVELKNSAYGGGNIVILGWGSRIRRRILSIFYGRVTVTTITNCYSTTMKIQTICEVLCYWYIFMKKTHENTPPTHQTSIQMPSPRFFCRYPTTLPQSACGLHPVCRVHVWVSPQRSFTPITVCKIPSPLNRPCPFDWRGVLREATSGTRRTCFWTIRSETLLFLNLSVCVYT